MIGISTIVQGLTGNTGGGSLEIRRASIAFAAATAFSFLTATAMAQQEPVSRVETALLPPVEDIVENAVELPSILPNEDVARYRRIL